MLWRQVSAMRSHAQPNAYALHAIRASDEKHYNSTVLLYMCRVTS